MPRKQPTAEEVAVVVDGQVPGPSSKASNRPSQPDIAASPLHIAVQGCCHGELSKIYAACEAHERDTGRRIDLLLCCGDFQAVRSPDDFSSLAVPEKYRELGDFHLYYSGKRVAPVLTVFIGGNHEVSQLLWEQYYGGVIAPNIVYLGHSGVLEYRGLKIAGLSGIFKGHDFRRPYPVPPYDSTSVRSAYHVREFEIAKLRAVREASVDVVLSHDWPVGITKFGDEEQLLRFKPYFEEDIRHQALGNPHTMELMHHLKPQFWFSAHLHCCFDAVVPHPTPANESVAGGEAGRRSLQHHQQPPHTTRFVALDKCARDMGFALKFFDITPRCCSGYRTAAAAHRLMPRHMPAPNPHSAHVDARLLYDAEWIEIARLSHPYRPVLGPTALRDGLPLNFSAALTVGRCDNEGPTLLTDRLPVTTTSTFVAEITRATSSISLAPRRIPLSIQPTTASAPLPVARAAVAGPDHDRAAGSTPLWEEDVGPAKAPS